MVRKIEASKTIRLMGTIIDLNVTALIEPERILGEMIERLHMYNQRFSANDEHSELSEVNNYAGVQPVVVHRELFDLIKLGKEHSVAPDSFLNIAIGPLIQTWRIGFEDATVPTDADVQAMLAITDPNDIILDETEQSVFLAKSGMKIDLGALAKGYIADRLLDYLAEVGAQSALINLGGNLVTFGPALKRPDSLWRIGIQNPVELRGQSQIILKAPQKSVVTSGIYERKLESNGETFHHIFNPKTGYPVETELASLTIVSDLSVDGEIWTTRLFGKASGEIIQSINHVPHIEGLVILQTGEVLYSAGMDKYL